MAGPSNALLAAIAQGAQPRMADAMSRGYQQGANMLAFQQQQQDRNALAKIAQAYAAGGPQAARDAAGQLGHYDATIAADKTLYGRGRDDVLDQRDARNFSYRQSRDTVGDQFRNRDFSFRQERANVGDQQWQQTFNANQNARNQRRDPTQVYQTRATVAEQMGLNPQSPEFQSYVLTGSLPRPGQGTKPTVDSAKAAGFHVRMMDSEKILSNPDVVNSVVDSTSGRINRLANEGISPLGALGPTITMPREFQDENYLKFDQARRDFVNAILRRESGAVISDQEFDNAAKQYFPQPGEGPDIIEQKRRNRLNAIEGVRMAAEPSLNAAGGQAAATGNKSSMKAKYGLK